MKNCLDNISSLIDTYESGEWVSCERLRIMLRELSCEVYNLTKINIEAYRKHNSILFSFAGSVSRGFIEADELVPELRDTRKIIAAANRVIDAMRSELSILKNES